MTQPTDGIGKPNSVNIIGITYRIEYVEKPSDVDIFKRKSLWGQIDFWTRTIRIHDSGRSGADLMETIMHEVIHGIAEALHLKALSLEENHDELGVLALALTDVMIRNGWVTPSGGQHD